MKKSNNAKIFYKDRAFAAEIAVIISLGAAFSVVGFCFGMAGGFAALGLSAAYLAVHIVFTGRRYRKISRLGESIDRILHGQDGVFISDNEEGELSILTSEVQKMTVRLRENADSLEKDKKMMADAVADISHQLRTPLTSMNLVVTMLSDDGIPERRRLELMRELKKELLRIDWLISALLKVSKIDAGTVTFKKENVSVGELVEKASEPLLISLELHGITLKTNTSGAAFTGDLQWTVEAIGNILKNCMEHTPDGGIIEVSAVETPIFTKITVADSGNGIDKEDLPHIFERFYKGKNSKAGSIGIGLALARMIIAGQNGTVTAENRGGDRFSEEHGALFTVRFYKSVV